MDLLTCHRCGSMFRPPFGDRVMVCPYCRTSIHPLVSARLDAVGGLIRHVQSAPYLPEALRKDLLARSEAEWESLASEQARLAGHPPPDEEKAPEDAFTPKPAAEPAVPGVNVPERGLPRMAPVPASPAPRRPTVWAKLGPVFAENLLFTLAAFLLVAGAVYFVTTAWTTMTGAERRLVVVGGLDLLGAVLIGAARLVNRGGDLPDVERLLLLVATFLVPVAAAPAGELFAESFGLGLLGSALVLVPGWFAARAAGRAQDPVLARVLPPALAAAAMSILAAHLLGGVPVLATFGGGIALALAVHVGAVRVLPSLGPGTAPALKVGLLFAFSALVFAAAVLLSAARLGKPVGTVVAVPGIVIAGMGLAAVLLETGLCRTGRLPSGRSFALLIGGLAAGFGGTVIAFGGESGLLVAAIFGSAAAVGAGLRLPGGLALIPGLTLTLIAYFMLPAPVRELATRLRDEAAGQLGYEPKRLPISFYGITFLPYVALSGLATVLLKRRGRPEHARALLGWTIAVAAGLAVLALFAGKDFRAPAAVLLAQGVLLLALSLPVRDARLVFAGVLGVFGGLFCGLLHLEAGTAANVASLSLAGIAAILIAARLERGRGGFGPAAARAALDAVLLVAAAMLAVVLLGVVREWPGPRVAPRASILGPAGLPDIGAFVLMTLFLISLFVVYRGVVTLFDRGAVVLTLVCLPLLRSVSGAVDALGGDRAAVPLLLACASVMPALFLEGAERARRFLPSRIPFSGETPRASLPLLAAALPIFGLSAIVDSLRTGEWSFALAAGSLLSALVVIVTARRARQGWAAGAAAVLVVVAGFAGAGAAGLDPVGAAGALGPAVGIAGVLGVLHLLPRSARDEGLFARPLGLVVPPLAALVLGRLAVRLIEPGYRDVIACDGLLLAVAAAALAIPLRLSLPRLRLCAGEASAASAGILAGVAAALVPVGVFDALFLPLEAYPVGLAAAAALVFSAARGWPALRAVAVAQLALALLIAFVAVERGDYEPVPLLLSFGGVACCAWLAAGRLPVLGGTLLLVSTLGALVFPLGDRLLALSVRWLPTLLLLFATAALLAPRIRGLRIEVLSARIVAIPIVSGVALAFAVWDSVVVLNEPSLPVGLSKKLALVSAAVSLVLATLALVGRRRTIGAVLATTFALLLAVAAFAPLNLILRGAFDIVPRPDIEVALVGLFAALRFPRPGPATGRRTPVDGAPGLAYPFAALALLLTAAEFRHASTPLALFAASFVPLALLVRSRASVHAAIHGYSLLFTVFAFVLFIVPDTGRPAAEILPLLGATAATMLALFSQAAARLPNFRPDFATAGRAYAHPAAAAAVAALLTVAANALVLRNIPADGMGIALSGFATGLTGFMLGRAARRSGRPWMLHGAVVSVLVLYGFLVCRTPFLDFLAGCHFHVLAAGGFGLLMWSGGGRPELRPALIADALLLGAPAVFASLPAILGVPVLDGREPTALFLAAALFGLAALRSGRPVLGGLAAAVLNLAIFAVWRRMGYVDPAFYGVPPGITMLLGAEVFRERLEQGARVGLVVVGVALLYGSVGVQVLRVEEPTHALVLFGLGLLTVFAGLWSRRNGAMIGGTAVVVLDVIAYLARHGFEESFLGAALLVVAGLTVLSVATVVARRRRRGAEDDR